VFFSKSTFVILLFLSNLEAFVVESSYSDAHKKAIREDKILMVFLRKKSCSSCNDMLTSLFIDKKVRNLIGKRATFTIVTQGQKESYPIEMLFTTEYPALFFLDKHELFACDAIIGEINLKKLEECLNPEVLKREKKQ